MLDTKALAEATATIVRQHLEAALAPVLARVDALEQRPGHEAVAEELRALAVTTAEQATATAVAALPPPAPGEPGKDGEDGKDGVGLAGMMIDRAGEAIATLTDGRIVKLGPVVGKDGNDGDPGKDGRDGRDLDDIQVTQAGAVVEFAFQIGETRSIYEVELPTGPPGADGQDAYAGEAKGLYDTTAQYRALDVVSFNGSEWRAKRDDPGELPGDGWMLSACKGKRGDPGKRGEPGKDGVSPVAQYLRGAELITTLSDGAELKADLSDLIEPQT